MVSCSFYYFEIVDNDDNDGVDQSDDDENDNRDKERLSISNLSYLKIFVRSKFQKLP